MTEFSRSANIRRLVLENPDITLEELRDKYKNGYEDTLPDKPHLLYQERGNVRSRLGIETLDDLPKHNNRFNISGFIRRFCSSMTAKEAATFCAYFGIEVSSALYATALKKTRDTKSPESAESEFEPDANQHTGPRVRKQGKPGRKIAAAAVSPSSVNGQVTYESIEDSLDDLIQRASGLKPELIQTLKNARRQVGTIILETH